MASRPMASQTTSVPVCRVTGREALKLPLTRTKSGELIKYVPLRIAPSFCCSPTVIRMSNSSFSLSVIYHTKCVYHTRYKQTNIWKSKHSLCIFATITHRISHLFRIYFVSTSRINILTIFIATSRKLTTKYAMTSMLMSIHVRYHRSRKCGKSNMFAK